MENATSAMHGGDSNHLDSTGLCLLSLDGGGVRGLSTLYILKGLMDRLNQERPNERPIKPCDVFDLIGGTSTGGLIAIMLGRLEMDVDECIAAYTMLMERVFGKKASLFPMGLSGSIKSRFDAGKLEGAINEVVTSNGAKPTDLFNDGADRRCRVFVCSIAHETKETTRLRSYSVPGKQSIPATICEAARATSAATTFFDPVLIGKRKFADGGLGANNPVDEVEGEASDIWCSDTGDLKPLVKCFVSIGTGNPGKKAMEDKLLKFVSTTLVGLVTQTEQTEKRFIAKWRQHFEKKRYFRFNVDQGLQNIGLAEYKEQGAIEAATHGYLDHQGEMFRVRDCVQNLRLKKSKTETSFAAVIQGLRDVSLRQQPDDVDVRWIVPFERNPHFTGREILLSRLHDKITGKDATTKLAVTGLGGVGKTQVVLELVYQIRDKNTNHLVIWIPVHHLEALHQACRDVATTLRIPGFQDSKADFVGLVQSFLSQENTGPWCLIFDNADSLDMWTSPLNPEHGSKRLMDYLPRNKQGTIIFTTRNRKVAVRLANQNVEEVTEMDESEASNLFKQGLISQELTIEEESALSTLLESLTYLPLAIVQAAAYINANTILLSEYLELLSAKEEEVIDLLSEEFEDDRRYHDVKNPTATTWLISFEQIRHRNRLAAQYLSFISCVDPKDIPQSLLPPAKSLKEHIDAIGTLQAYSFLSKQTGHASYDVHRLVHMATRGWLRKEQKLAEWHFTAVSRLNELLVDVDLVNRSKWRPYLSHAQYVLDSCDGGDNDETEIKLLELYGRYLGEDGRYNEAELILQHALKNREDLFGPDHPDTLIAVANVGSILHHQGRYEEAMIMVRRALEGFERVLGPEHIDTLIAMNSLGRNLQRQGKMKEAELLHQRALDLSEKTLGPESHVTHTSMNDLGMALSYQGRYDEAEIMLRRAVDSREAVFGPNHPYTLSSLDTLAGVFREQGKYEEGGEILRRVFKSQTSLLGCEHPATLTTANNLAMTLQCQGKYGEAETMHRHTLNSLEKITGPEHPDTLSAVNNLATALYSQGKYKEAEEMFQRSLSGFEDMFHPEHPMILTTLNNFGLTLSGQNKHEEAEMVYRRSWTRHKEALGPTHPKTLDVLKQLCNTLERQGRHKEAEAIRPG